MNSRNENQAAFFRAIKSGDLGELLRLLEAEPALANAHAEECFGAVPIALAAERNDCAMIDLLLGHGAEVNGKSSWWAGGFGALDFAGEETARHLLAKGAHLTAHAAARLGWLDALKEILSTDPGAVQQRGGDGQFPLHYASTPEIVDLLVDAGADLEARDLDHVSTAAQTRIKDGAVCRRLLERGARPDIYIAVMLEDIPLLHRLIDEDPECLSRMPTDPGNPMIHRAPGLPIYTYTIGLGQPFQVALQHGKGLASQAIYDRSSPAQRLLIACWSGDADTARALAAHVKDLTAREQALLPAAAWERKLEVVRLMLELGFDADATGVHHSSALDRAAFHGFDDVVELVLRYQPSLTIKNEFGGTPLGACIFGSLNSWREDGNFPRCVEMLLEAGSSRPEKSQGSAAVNEVLLRYGIGIG
ncbi:ankyrin repeat domain-containing protein [Haloferula sp. BvORR071]|uniref:ankyrin repeat domain-containing protein n=1 Tax=Haloferula sp. BvORR071 TaxID=1396141 RepID=UPI0005586C37|nr:ankyrin repeat domain-containing protein [Haloferula sp. BvORR071]